MSINDNLTAAQMINKTVFWRHESGVQIAAQIVRVYSRECVNLLVLSDGYLDLGAGMGMPVPKTNVVLGDGHYNWSWELDQYKAEQP